MTSETSVWSDDTEAAIKIGDTRMDDFEAIRRLAADYCWYVDGLDPDHVAALFTPNARFDARPIGLELFDGKQAVLDFFTAVLGATAHSQHMSGNHRIDVDGDAATGTSYYYAQGRFKDGADFSAAGYYDDRYTRTADGWRISHRVGVPLLPAEVSAISAQLDAG